MAHSIQEVTVKLSKPIHSGLMYIEPVASVGRIAPELQVTEGLINKKIFKIRVVNNTDTPVSVPCNAPIGIARNITVNRVTEYCDFFIPVDDSCGDSFENKHNQGDSLTNPMCPECFSE